MLEVVKGKGSHEQKANTTGAYTDFRSMKRVPRSIATPPGRDSSLLQGYPHQFVSGTHLYNWVNRVKFLV